MELAAQVEDRHVREALRLMKAAIQVPFPFEKFAFGGSQSSLLF